ncbi:hypothetical protein EDB87DRAFT_1622755 [Lactarius vividus]|nr:hypothetical protein EDB87DRAFT_1622755 [Lactarius vividus]
MITPTAHLRDKLLSCRIVSTQSTSAENVLVRPMAFISSFCSSWKTKAPIRVLTGGGSACSTASPLLWPSFSSNNGTTCSHSSPPKFTRGVQSRRGSSIHCSLQIVCALRACSRPQISETLRTSLTHRIPLHSQTSYSLFLVFISQAPCPPVFGWKRTGRVRAALPHMAGEALRSNQSPCYYHVG